MSNSNEFLLEPVVEKIVLLDNLNVSHDKIRSVLSPFEEKLNSICADTLIKMSRTGGNRVLKKRLGFQTPLEDVDQSSNGRDGRRNLSKPRYGKRRSRSGSAIRPRSIIRPSSLPRRSKSAVRVLSEFNGSESEYPDRKITPVSKARNNPNKRRKIRTPNENIENINITKKSLRSYRKQKNESLEDEAIECSFDVSSIVGDSESQPFMQKKANIRPIFSPYATRHSKKTRMSATSSPK